MKAVIEQVDIIFDVIMYPFNMTVIVILLKALQVTDKMYLNFVYATQMAHKIVKGCVLCFF